MKEINKHTNNNNTRINEKIPSNVMYQMYPQYFNRRGISMLPVCGLISKGRVRADQSVPLKSLTLSCLSGSLLCVALQAADRGDGLCVTAAFTQQPLASHQAGGLWLGAQYMCDYKGRGQRLWTEWRRK